MSKKAMEYIGESADLLDLTRRDLQDKFRPPFENLNYPSFSLSRKSSNCSESSSFFCQGEGKEEKVANAQAVQDLRRLSGDGTSPWTQAPPSNCRLCKIQRAGPIRALCGGCERASIQRRLSEPGLSYPSNPYEFEDEGYEVKPPPPLKDRKYSMLNDNGESKPVFHVAGEMTDDAIETRVQSADADANPMFVHPMVKRQAPKEA